MIFKNDYIINACRSKNVLHIGATDAPYHKIKKNRKSMKYYNIFKQAIIPSRGIIMTKKLITYFFDHKGELNQETLNNWLKDNTVDFEDIAIKLNQDLWNKSLELSKMIENNADEKLKEIPYELGGGGIYPFLIFLVLYRKPEVIVETGVAAGFSSYGFLEAIRINEKGKLYSSDFPYFRIPNPENYIGVIVPKNLKNNWNLYIEGDQINLPKIIIQIDNIDIFHYDSDKSYKGREFAMNTILPKVKDDGIIIMDDIQDNSFFYDYIKANNIKDYYIFKFLGKFVGIIGKLN